MWTPKRVLLLVAGIAVFLTGYEVYAYFLGGIDGLPPLPLAYLPVPEGTPHSPPPPKESDADRKLRQAFGAECAEVSRPIKLDVRSRRMVVATNEVNIGDDADGRVRMNDFSLAMWGNNAGDAAYPEINTIRSDVAYLTFDRPVSNPLEMGNRKIVACELRGHITLINNRRTPQKNDDIEVRVLTEPLFFDEKQNKIWTEGYVQLLDTQTRPQPTMIRARGLDLFLTRDNAKPAAKPGPAPRPKGDTISGVDVVVLRSNVDMHLWVDAGSGFLSGGEKGQKPGDSAARQKAGARPAGPKTAEPEKSHVVIRTQGPFKYLVARDLARFDSPPASAKPSGDLDLDDQVVVTREYFQEVTPAATASLVGHAGIGLEGGPLAAAGGLIGGRNLVDAKQYDTLTCDHLELQFRRKADADARASHDDRSSEKEIETAHAVARPSKEVLLISEKEQLEAHGNEFFYLAAAAAHGPQTIIKGEPLIAIKGKNKIKARELQLVSPDQQGNGQRAYARGPGQIDLWDDKTKTFPTHAVWRDALIALKDRDGDRIYDLLTLTGDAGFIDEEHDQEMYAQRLQVWLEPPDHAYPPNDPPPMKEMVPGAPRQRPHKLEAFEHVKTRSNDLIIHDSDHLIVRFKDAPPTDVRLPDALPPAAAGPTPVPQPAADQAAAVTPPGARGPGLPGDASVIPGPTLPSVVGQDSSPAASGPATATAATEKPAPPSKAGKKSVELWGRSVAVYVLRTGPKNDLQELVTEGAVHVHQDGSNAEDKGVDIKGETLNLLHDVKGDVLIVFGDSHGVAELQFGEMFLSGPKVTINQKENTAEVEGVGCMTMPSNTTFEGGKPTRAGTRLTVHWNQYMLFEGKVANFHGGVVAYQDDASLRCKALEVTLDRVVSFKQGQKGGQQAKVEKLVGSLDVYVVDTTRDKEQGGKLVRYQRLVARGLDMNNQDGPVIASGPGKVYVLQYGSPNDGLPAPGQASAAPGAARPKAAAPRPPGAEEVLKLTRIDFGGRMFSNNKSKDRITKFYDNVEVYHQPADNPDVKVDPDHPPKDGLYLRCSLLTVFSQPLANGKTNQLMRAEKTVSFRTPEFYGTADIVKYDESKEQIIFEGVGGNFATLYRFGPQGQTGPTKELKGRMILYERKTGKFIIDGGNQIIGRSQPEGTGPLLDEGWLLGRRPEHLDQPAVWDAAHLEVWRS